MSCLSIAFTVIWLFGVDFHPLPSLPRVFPRKFSSVDLIIATSSLLDSCIFFSRCFVYNQTICSYLFTRWKCFRSIIMHLVLTKGRRRCTLACNHTSFRIRNSNLFCRIAHFFDNLKEFMHMFAEDVCELQTHRSSFLSNLFIEMSFNF